MAISPSASKAKNTLLAVVELGTPAKVPLTVPFTAKFNQQSSIKTQIPDKGSA